MGYNKKGMITSIIIVCTMVAFFLMVYLGVQSYAFGIIDEQFSQIDFTLGNTSFAEEYNNTLKIGVTAMETEVPVIVSSATLLGMVLMMIIAGYFSQQFFGDNKLWLLMDFFILIVAEIVAWVISTNFITYINSTPEFLDIYTNTLSAGSTFVARLPVLIPVIWLLVVLATYLTVRKRGSQPAGFT